MLKKTIGMKGFTLAEVLITLGIIGVVAAMTMPTLINSTQGAQYKTAYKKALSVMSQAVVMNIALEDYDLSQTVAGTNTTAESAEGADDGTEVGGTQSIYELFKNRMNVVKVSGNDDIADTYKIIDATALGTDAPGGGHTFNVAWPTITSGTTKFGFGTTLFFNDGIVFSFDNTQSACAAGTEVVTENYCWGFIDVNGEKGPNKVVRCDNDVITGGTAGSDDATCTVSNPTDIYPVMFFDQSILPATAAARAVLYAK